MITNKIINSIIFFIIVSFSLSSNAFTISISSTCTANTIAYSFDPYTYNPDFEIEFSPTAFNPDFTVQIVDEGYVAYMDNYSPAYFKLSSAEIENLIKQMQRVKLFKKLKLPVSKRDIEDFKFAESEIRQFAKTQRDSIIVIEDYELISDYEVCESINGQTVKISNNSYDPDFIVKISNDSYDPDFIIFNNSNNISTKEAISVLLIPQYSILNLINLKLW